jgi:hypothetical protein
MKINNWKRILLIVSAICVAPMSYADADGTKSQIYLSKDTDENRPGTTPQSEFLCTDTIYATLNGNWKKGTEHKLEAYWNDPQGKQRKHSTQKFTAYGASRVWIWFRLHRGDDNALSRMFGLSEDSMQEFVGKWKVDFYLDGKKVSRSHFTVSC